MGEKPILRRAGRFATGVALGSAVLGLHGDVNPNHLKSKVREGIEFKQERLNHPKKLLNDLEFRKELEKENENAKRLLKKYDLKELTREDVSGIIKSIKSDLIELQLNEPEIMKASIFDLKATINELESLGKSVIESLINAGKNFWNSKDSVILAELIALATYLHIANKLSRGQSFSRAIEKDRFSLSNYHSPGVEHYPVMFALAIFVANHSHLSLPIIFLNPSVRYYLSKLIEKARR